MIKGLIQEENIAIVNIYAPNIGKLVYISQMLTAIKREINSNTIIVQFSHSVMSDSLRPHESQHARPPCPSPTPGVYSNLCPSSQWPSRDGQRWPSSHLILCRPLLFLPPIPPSIRVFSSESPLRMRWPKYWSFNFSISPSNEHPGLISFWGDFNTPRSSMDRSSRQKIKKETQALNDTLPQMHSIFFFFKEEFILYWSIPDY